MAACPETVKERLYWHGAPDRSPMLSMKVADCASSSRCSRRPQHNGAGRGGCVPVGRKNRGLAVGTPPERAMGCRGRMSCGRAMEAGPATREGPPEDAGPASGRGTSRAEGLSA
jgi:hypothetical protein